MPSVWTFKGTGIDKHKRGIWGGHSHSASTWFSSDEGRFNWPEAKDKTWVEAIREWPETKKELFDCDKGKGQRCWGTEKVGEHLEKFQNLKWVKIEIQSCSARTILVPFLCVSENSTRTVMRFLTVCHLAGCYPLELTALGLSTHPLRDVKEVRTLLSDHQFCQ